MVRSVSTPRTIPGRNRRAGAVDVATALIVAVVVALGGYGIYDLMVAPQTVAQAATDEAAGSQLRGTSDGGVLSRDAMVDELCPGQRQVNILVIGTDEKVEGGRADTIMLVMLRKDTKRVAAVSIPRDLKVLLPGHGAQKINAVYAYHRETGDGEAMTARAVEQILEVPVDRYIKTDVAKFYKLFDAFGGLELYVDQDMNYHDRAGDLHIDLEKGYHHLDGKQIEGFVRHRHDRKRSRESTDFERTQRQQYVLKELVRQKAHFASVGRLPQIVQTLKDMIRTDMIASELVGLGLLAKQMDLDNVVCRVVPTHAERSSAWYAVLLPGAAEAMMTELAAVLEGAEIPDYDGPEVNPEIGDGALVPAQVAERKEKKAEQEKQAEGAGGSGEGGED